MKTIKIINTASQLPEKIVSNDDLSKIMDTSDEWISSRTGIKNRHIAVEETTASLAAGVIKKLLLQSQVDPAEIGFIIVATMSPDSTAPAAAAKAEQLAGLNGIAAFDLNAACSGFAFAFTTASGLVNSLDCKYGIVIGSETLSKLVDWQDRRTAVLFGDGAGGVLVQAVDEDERLLASDLKTLAGDADYLTAGFLPRQGWGQKKLGSPYFQMDGHAVYSFATRQVSRSISDAFAKAKLKITDADWFLLHQANQRIIDKVADLLGVSQKYFLSSLKDYGNTSAASIPILLDLSVKKGLVKRGQLIVFSGFGAGLSVGTVIYRY